MNTCVIVGSMRNFDSRERRVVGVQPPSFSLAVQPWQKTFVQIDSLVTTSGEAMSQRPCPTTLS